MLNAKAQNLLKQNRCPMQFCATTKFGCSEASFFIKTLQQSGREDRVDAHAVFVNLVKSHDSVKHEVMGIPEKCIKYTENINGNFNAAFKIGAEDIVVESEHSSRQGDVLALDFFAIVMPLVAKDELKDLKRNNNRALSVKNARHNKGVLILRKKEDETWIETEQIVMLVKVDDILMTLGALDNLISACKIMCNAMLKLGLIELI